MSNDRSVFSFELNESLYFEKGQEVDEMRGISLDPEITIQPFHDYIAIRGVIELQGEFFRANNETPDQVEASEFAGDYHAKRFVEQVTDTEDGGAEFSHRFPVEISVPRHRVENLDEVMVSIESFDYELVEERQLTFTSAIAIYGITEQDEEEVTGGETTNTLTQSVGQTFDFDIKESQQNLEEGISETITPEEYQDMPALSEETESSEESNSSERWKHKKTQSLSEFLKKEPAIKSETEQVESPSSGDENPHFEYDPSDQDQGNITEGTYPADSVQTGDNLESPDKSTNDNGWESPSSLSSVPTMEDTAEVIDDVNSLVSPQINENVETEKNETADVRYLSDMFRYEEEHFSRMRVCIVQEEDTLERIAERYNISTLNIIKQNHLEDDEILEGQLLQIPEQKK